MLLLEYHILLKINQCQIDFKRFFEEEIKNFKLLISLTLPLGLGATANVFTAAEP